MLFRSAVLGWLLVVCDGNLARSTAVDGTAHEVQWLRGAESHRVAGTLRVVDTATLLARKVASILLKGAVVESRLSEWLWGSHHDVGARIRGHAESGNDG